MITIGTKVAILPCDDYRNRFIGTQGIVQRYYHNKVGVRTIHMMATLVSAPL